MKKMLIALTIMSSFYATADWNRRDNRDNDLSCKREVNELTKENLRLSQELLSCKADSNDRGGRGGHDRGSDDREVRELKFKLKETEDRLASEIQRSNSLTYTLEVKDNRILDLEARVRTLEDQIYPAPGRFDLAQSISACKGINNAQYVMECAQAVRDYSIVAEVVAACAEINNAYYAKECVKTVGQFNGRAPQVKACSKIQNDQYVYECVGDASKGNVRADVIRSCVESSNNAYYQKQCVKQMMKN